MKTLIITTLYALALACWLAACAGQQLKAPVANLISYQTVEGLFTKRTGRTESGEPVVKHTACITIPMTEVDPPKSASCRARMEIDGEHEDNLAQSAQTAINTVLSQQPPHSKVGPACTWVRAQLAQAWREGTVTDRCPDGLKATRLKHTIELPRSAN